MSATIIVTAAWIAHAALGLAMALCTWRMIVGPTQLTPMYCAPRGS